MKINVFFTCVKRWEVVSMIYGLLLSSRNFSSKLNSFKANKLIKQLNNKGIIQWDNETQITHALKIYNAISEQKNEYVTASYLKLCLKLKCPSKGLKLLNLNIHTYYY